MSTVKLPIGPADLGRRMSLDEFREAEEQPGYLYELARGVLEVTNVPDDPHNKILDNLHEGFSAYRREHPRFIYLIGHGSEIRLVIPEFDSDRHPDLAIVFKDTRRDAGGVRRASLVVEIVSPGKRARQRDYEEKREEYLAVGVVECWIIDPMLRRVTLLTRQEAEAGATWAEAVLPADGTIRSGLLPDFAFRVTDLWADADPDDDEMVDL